MQPAYQGPRRRDFSYAAVELAAGAVGQLVSEAGAGDGGSGIALGSVPYVGPWGDLSVRDVDKVGVRVRCSEDARGQSGVEVSIGEREGGCAGSFMGSGGGMEESNKQIMAVSSRWEEYCHG